MKVGEVYSLNYKKHFNSISLGLVEEKTPTVSNPKKKHSNTYHILNIDSYSYYIDKHFRHSIKHRLSYIKGRTDRAEDRGYEFDPSRGRTYLVLVTVLDLFTVDGVEYARVSKEYKTGECEYVFHVSFIKKYWSLYHAIKE